MENNLAKITPTQLSLKKLRDEGYTVWITEHWNSFSRTRQDMYGYCDIIAVRKNETLAVQTTTKSNMSARIHKIADNVNAPKCREANWRIEVHGWFQSENGWECKIEDLS